MAYVGTCHRKTIEMHYYISNINTGPARRRFTIAGKKENVAAIPIFNKEFSHFALSSSVNQKMESGIYKMKLASEQGVYIEVGIKFDVILNVDLLRIEHGDSMLANGWQLISSWSNFDRVFPQVCEKWVTEEIIKA